MTTDEKQLARKRQEEFLAAISPALAQAEDALPATVSNLNASPRAKLQKIYQLVDELARAREPYVACGKGCSSCCHMNVSVTALEAERLARASGRKANRVARSTRHAIDKFAGAPCPFLDAEGACSVYADRPLACRKHSSFFADAARCHPSVMNDDTVPMIGFSGLDEALAAVSARGGDLILADIRDFFPPQPRE